MIEIIDDVIYALVNENMIIKTMKMSSIKLFLDIKWTVTPIDKNCELYFKFELILMDNNTLLLNAWSNPLTHNVVSLHLISNM